METLFLISNFIVVPAWFLLVVLPHWTVTHRLARSIWPFILLPVVYLALLIPHLPELVPFFVNPPELARMSALLGSLAGTTIAWLHFLALDLFVGRWIYLDSRMRSFSVWWVSPVLAVTFLAGPFGLLLYLMIRALRGPASDHK